MNNKRLIELVRGYECLYNLKYRYSRYSDLKQKEAAWKEIATVLNQPASACKKTWQVLRDAYRRALVARNKKGLRKQDVKKWTYENEMEFLIPYYRLRLNRISSILADDDEFENSESNEPDHTAEEDTNTALNIAAADVADCFGSETTEVEINAKDINCLSLSELSDMLKVKQNQSIEAPRNNELDRFFSNISDTVKKFPPYQQALAKNQIFSIVSEMELQLLEPSRAVKLKSDTTEARFRTK